MTVSVLPFVSVSVNTVFRRYVPLDSPLLVFSIEILHEFTVLVQLAPFTAVHVVPWLF